IPGDNSVPAPVGALNDQCSVFINLFRFSDQNSVCQFYFYLLFSLTEIGFPARRDGTKSRLLENSIAPVEGLNQSPEELFATNKFLLHLHQRSGVLADGIGHLVLRKVYVDADAKNDEFNAFRSAAGLGQNSCELLLID